MPKKQTKAALRRKIHNMIRRAPLPPRGVIREPLKSALAPSDAEKAIKAAEAAEATKAAEAIKAAEAVKAAAAAVKIAPPPSPAAKKTFKDRAQAAYKYTKEAAVAAKDYIKQDPLTAFYEIGPWFLLIGIFLVFLVAGAAELLGCSYDWTKLVPTFGLRDRIYVMG